MSLFKRSLIDDVIKEIEQRIDKFEEECHLRWLDKIKEALDYEDVKYRWHVELVDDAESKKSEAKADLERRAEEFDKIQERAQPILDLIVKWAIALLIVGFVEMWWVAWLLIETVGGR